MLRRLIVASTLAVAIVDAGQVFAQVAFPAPLPGQAEAPASNASPGVSAAFPSGSRADACMTEYASLRGEAEERSRLLKVASDRRAPADEACKLIGSFGQAEIKMIKYIETNSAKCGIPPQIADQLRRGHKNTEKIQKQVCAGVQLAQARGPNSVPGDATRRVPTGPVGDFGHWINRQVP